MTTGQDPRPSRSALSRRTLLLSAIGGAVAGSTVGAVTTQWWFGPPETLKRQTDRSLRIVGGTDKSGARKNALQVWEQTPTTRQARLSATYEEAGDSSTDQIDKIENQLKQRSGAPDLVVIDPEYLPGLVRKGLLRPLSDRTARMLSDAGCISELVERCRIDGDLFAVPLSADVPMLVVDLSVFPENQTARVTARVDDLRKINDPERFWTEAVSIGQAAPGKAAPMLQTGDYEGLTVCLIELIHAFGGDIAKDPALAGQPNRDALAKLKRTVPRSSFEQPQEGGDERAVQAAVQDHGTACARLWPVQCRDLITVQPDETQPGTERSPGYRFVPIPRGVLGGQVLALAEESRSHAAAEQLAGYLAQPLSQLQLYHNGGYLPTLAESYVDQGIRDQLHDLTNDRELDLSHHLVAAVRRPKVPEYIDWSDQFRNSVRDFLLDLPDSSPDAITERLNKYAPGKT